MWDLPARLWTIARKIEEVLALQSKTREALEALEHRLRSLEDRMTRLEAGQHELVTTARAAANVAAVGVAAAAVSDIVTRVTRIEMQQTVALSRLPP